MFAEWWILPTLIVVGVTGIVMVCLLVAGMRSRNEQLRLALKTEKRVSEGILSDLARLRQELADVRKDNEENVAKALSYAERVGGLGTMQSMLDHLSRENCQLIGMVENLTEKDARCYEVVTEILRELVTTAEGKRIISLVAERRREQQRLASGSGG